MENKRNRPQVVRGVVVSDKMNKTRVIEIKRTVRHDLYHKSLLRGTKLFVHDEKNQSKAGDVVMAIGTRPMSKNKSFKVIKVVQERAAE
jgi:small subunit ribosomal protein S17